MNKTIVVIHTIELKSVSPPFNFYLTKGGYRGVKGEVMGDLILIVGAKEE